MLTAHGCTTWLCPTLAEELAGRNHHVEVVQEVALLGEASRCVRAHDLLNLLRMVAGNAVPGRGEHAG